MSYTVSFGAGGAAKFTSLSETAQDALIARAVELGEAPWDGVWVQAGGANRAFRETSFGGGRGLMVFYVDDDAEVIRVYDLVWLG